MNPIQTLDLNKSYYGVYSRGYTAPISSGATVIKVTQAEKPFAVCKRSDGLQSADWNTNPHRMVVQIVAISEPAESGNSRNQKQKEEISNDWSFLFMMKETDHEFINGVVYLYNA